MTRKSKKPAARKGYQTPELRVHGDLRQHTLLKKGTMADGGGAKPNTKASGANS